jgi:hypothetical protein
MRGYARWLTCECETGPGCVTRYTECDQVYRVRHCTGQVHPCTLFDLLN